jgi:hypothetical protein
MAKTTTSRYRLKNTNDLAGRVLYGMNKVPIYLGPGEEKEVTLSDDFVVRYRQRDTDVVAARVGGEMPPQVPSPQTAMPEGQPERIRTRIDPVRVVIPHDWRDLEWPQLRKLAASVSKAPIRRRTDAEASIEAEIARRSKSG